MFMFVFGFGLFWFETVVVVEVFWLLFELFEVLLLRSS
jgi:hypothetical protein